MTHVDINCDMGESFGVYSYGNDAAMMPHITSANVACGFHGGDPTTMRNTVELAVKHGVAVGAHVGLPDRLGFGRREIQISPEDAYDYVLYQIGALDGFLKILGVAMTHVKLHGAMYMMAARDAGIARATARAIAQYDSSLAVYTLAGSALFREAEQRGMRVLGEFYADRPYTPDGVKMFGWTLEEIGQPSDCAKRVRNVVDTGSLSLDGGSELSIRVDSVCIHSDTPGAPQIAAAVREGLMA